MLNSFPESAYRPSTVAVSPSRYSAGRAGQNWARWTAAVAFGWIMWAGSAAAGMEAGPTNFDELYHLPQATAAKGLRFTCYGVVLCYDAGWNQLYFGDGKRVYYFPAQKFQISFQQGDYVKISGVTGIDGSGLALTNLEAVVLGKRPTQTPTRIDLTNLVTTSGEWIQIEGEVLSADTNSGRLGIILHQGNQNCAMYVMGPPGPNDPALTGARIRVIGVNTSDVENGRLVSPGMSIAGRSDLLMLEPPRVQLAQLPVSSIDSVLHREVGPWTNEIVHLNGWIEDYRPGEYLTLKDPTGLIRADVIQLTPAESGERADVWGFVATTAEGVKLESACFALATMTTLRESDSIAPARLKSEGTNGLKSLTTAAAIRRLTPEETARGYPVRLRGVVTYADPSWHCVFIQDVTDALFIKLDRNDIYPGQFVELTGQTGPGDFAPVVVKSKFRILGTTNLPHALRVDTEDLADGHLDSRWIQMTGVIRRASQPDANHLKLAVIGETEKFTVIVPGWTKPAPVDWVDSRISVRGVCTTDVTLRRQLRGITIFTPDISHIRTLEAAPADPFAAPVIPIGSVATFSPGRAGRRVGVNGVVTMLLPGQGFVLQDSSGGIRIRTEETNEIEVGDRVNAVGFPALGEFSPHLESAIFRRAGAGVLPATRSATAEDILRSGAYDNTAVELQAELLQRVTHSLEPKLVLQDGPITFTATLLNPKEAEAAFALAPGSLLRLRGICLIEGDAIRGAETFQLALSRPDAVEVVRAPPSWRAQDSLKVAGGMGLATAVALTWIWLLRRQVRLQTEIIRANQTKLIEASRQAGMAEVATGVLHNVGNILNSVNVSASIVSEKTRRSKVGNLSKLAALLREHETTLAEFLTNDAQGRQIPHYIGQLAGHLTEEQRLVREELDSLEKNIEHIKNIVSMQQNYAKVAGVVESVQPAELVEDALRLNSPALSRHQVQIHREYAADLPLLTLDKHKALQILVNLIHNAKYACAGPEMAEKRLTLRVTNGDGRVRIAVIDTGMGIPQENLTKIFRMGFTTRKDGHGFGLHSGALAARELGGTLVAHSDGPGKGAKFTLELPLANVSHGSHH